MKESQQQALIILFLAAPVLAIAGYFLALNFFITAPKSTEPDYYAVYETENQLYYGGPCRSLFLGTVQDDLVECREGPLPTLLNRQNGTVLGVDRPWDIQKRWFPSGERVFVDYANGYVFWAKDGKVTNFVILDPKLKAQLLTSPPRSEVGASAPGGDERHGGGTKLGKPLYVNDPSPTRQQAVDDQSASHAPTPTPSRR